MGIRSRIFLNEEVLSEKVKIFGKPDFRHREGP
jgi:hypothetical protein